jgi:hypothetical protein
MLSFEGVWFASCEDICKCYVNDEEDKRIMALPDVRGVEKMPADYGWKQG